MASAAPAAGTGAPFSDSSVMVAVRIRPFNKRETDLKSTAVAHKVGPQALHMDDDPGTRQDDARDYGFDAVIDNGSQKEVYDATAEHVVDRVLDGFNACVFAYGQTGSGKSYSMMGPEGSTSREDEGIIPRMCRDILARLEALKAKKCTGTIEAR